MKKPELSIIIVSYNTKKLLKDCLNSIKKYMDEVSMEVIVSDNASSDGSAEMVKKDFTWVKFIEGPNDGFSKGNNRAKPLTEGKMVLFLNPDTVVHKNVFRETVSYLKNHKEVGAITCKLLLPNGKLDKDCRRRFPTPWISFKRLFLGDGNEYWYMDKPVDEIQEVEVIEGAFFLTWRRILDKVGWFDEDYFLQGEDIDLSWQINKLGYKNIYYPNVYVTHIKGAVQGKSKRWKSQISLKEKIKVRLASVDAMEIFFRKRLFGNYPILFSWFVLLGISLYRALRVFITLIKSVL